MKRPRKKGKEGKKGPTSTFEYRPGLVLTMPWDSPGKGLAMMEFNKGIGYKNQSNNPDEVA